MIKKNKKPKFHRQNSQVKKRAGTRWRKPRGVDSKQRKGYKSRGAKPTTGYQQPKKTRGKHPSGYEDVLVTNLAELNGIKKEAQAIRISSKIGAKKKEQIVKKAQEKQIKILNPKINRKKKTIKKKEETKEKNKETKQEKKEQAKKEDKEVKKQTKTEKEEEKTETKTKKQEEAKTAIK